MFEEAGKPDPRSAFAKISQLVAVAEESAGNEQSATENQRLVAVPVPNLKPPPRAIRVGQERTRFGFYLADAHQLGSCQWAQNGYPPESLPHGSRSTVWRS